MATFHIYGDESGKLKTKSDYTSFCGYVAHVSEWERFSLEWNNCRLRWQVPPVHMARVMFPDNKDDEWRKVKEDWGKAWEKKRELMLGDFAATIRSAQIVCVGAVHVHPKAKPRPQRHIRSGATEEIKLDGYRAIAVKADGRVNLFSRRRKSFDHHYPLVVEALGELSDGTVVDGEIVALDDSGKPDFNLLQNFRSEATHIQYFVFDVLICQDRDLTGLPLSERRKLMKSHLKLHSNRIRIAEQFEVSASDMLAAVRQQKLEGVVGKRKDSLYEPGKRSGSWVKCRVNRGQELVIGGYIPGPHGFDSLIVGYYQGKDLMYVARVRNGFVPASRRQVFEKIRHLVSPIMPFVNLPDTHKSRWGDELTAEKMKECIWLRPEAVAHIEFLEWTTGDRLRHSKFVGLREDKDARQVVKERARES